MVMLFATVALFVMLALVFIRLQRIESGIAIIHSWLESPPIGAVGGHGVSDGPEPDVRGDPRPKPTPGPALSSPPPLPPRPIAETPSVSEAFTLEMDDGPQEYGDRPPWETDPRTPTTDAKTTSPKARPRSVTTPIDARRIEAAIGGTWLVRVGAIVLLLGVGFLLKHSWEQNWVTPEQRALSGFGFGLVLHFLAHRFFKRDYDALAQGFAGCGSAVLYLTVFTAYGWYDLIGQSTAFAALVGVTIGTVIVALRHRALALAVLALIGAFLTPALVRSDIPDPNLLFSYLGLVAAGFITLATMRHWRILTTLSFIGVCLWFALWSGTPNHGEHPWSTSAWATLHAVLFASAFVVPNLIRHRSFDRHDLIMFVINGGAWLAATAGALLPIHERGWGALVLGFASMCAFFGEFVERRKGDDRNALETLRGTGIAFLLLGLVHVFDGALMTVSIASAAVFLSWLIVKKPGGYAITIGALGVHAVAAGRVLMVHMRLGIESGPHSLINMPSPFFNVDFLVSWCVPVAILLCAWIIRAQRHQVLVTSAVCSALLLLRELDLYWIDGSATAAAARTAVLSGRMFALLAFAFAFALWSRAGRERKQIALPALTLLCVGVGTACTLLLLGRLQEPPAMFLLNGAFLKMLVAPLTCFCVTRMVRYGVMTRRMLLTLVGVLPFIALSIESFRAFAAESGSTQSSIEGGQAALTVTWTLYAAILLVLGVVNRQSVLRFTAMGLLAVVLVKVCVFDLAFLDPIYRIVSFIGLGLIMMSGAWLYHRFSKRLALPPSRPAKDPVEAT